MLFIKPLVIEFTMTGSGKSKSIEPRRLRLRFRIIARSRIRSNVLTRGA